MPLPPWTPLLDRHPKGADRAEPLLEFDGKGLPLFTRGEVRDTFDLEHHLLMVTTDRVAANGIVLRDGIPDKGKLTTALSRWWFQRLEDLCPNHLADDVEWPARLSHDEEELAPRSLLVHKATVIPVECTVIGYLSDSAFHEYLIHGMVGGVPLESGVLRSERLPEPRFVPSIRAGAERTPILVAEMANRFGTEVTDRLQELSVAIYRFAEQTARPLDVIIAETTLEFGWIEGELCLVGECITPDSSSYWASEAHVPGASPTRLGKDFLLEWLSALGWDGEGPGPRLPEPVVLGVRERYLEAYGRVTGVGSHFGLHETWQWSSSLGRP